MKELKRSIDELKAKIDEMHDDVKTGSGGNVQFVFGNVNDSEESSDGECSESDSVSAHSAPATVSYDREGRE